MSKQLFVHSSTKELMSQADKALKGEVVKIDNPLEGRIKKVFNILPSRYTIIGGATGSGKTSYGDYSYVLGSHDFLKRNNLLNKVHWEVNYFSLERKQMFKHAKWISWKIYMDKGYKIPADQILGWADEPMTPALFELVEEYTPYIEELLEYVRIFDGKVGVDVLERTIKERALSLGVLFKTDGEGLFEQDNPIPIKTFAQNGEEVQTKRGIETIIRHSYKGEEFYLFKDQHKYFLHNPLTFVFFMIDGIGLMAGTEFKDKKSKIDRISHLLADARDMYGFAPVIISQLNRAIGDVQRRKLHGSDLSPQIEDIQDSSQTAHDADLIIAVFDPFRYKSYDNKGFYGDINVTNGMMSPAGFCRFRSLHILKNSFGYDGKIFGTLFIGESNHFKLLPSLNDADGQSEMQKIYSQIADDTI